jgi:hypothetical protein
MWHFLSCQDCDEAAHPPDPEKTKNVLPSGRNYVALPWHGEGLTSGVCSKGHAIVNVLQGPKHELLFEAGAVAHACGFHREAVTSFWAALERFFEFAIEVILTDLGTPDDVIETVWARMSKQSERQFGAFLALHAVRLGAFPHLKAYEKLVPQRNDYIHKGEIPQEGEAREFGTCVFEIIMGTTEALTRKCRAAVDRVKTLALVRRHNKVGMQPVPGKPGVKRRSTTLMASMFAPEMVVLSEGKTWTFEVAFGYLKDRLALYGHAPGPHLPAFAKPRDEEPEGVANAHAHEPSRPDKPKT